jgi:hypothetical protein
MLVRDSLTVLVAVSLSSVTLPFIAPVSVPGSCSTSSCFGISKTAPHSEHSATSPASSAGTLKMASQPGHETSSSLSGIMDSLFLV